MILILLIIGCSLIGSVFLIGVCGAFSATIIPTATPKNDTPSTVIEEPFRGDGEFDDDREDRASDENVGEDGMKSDLRKWIASRSVSVLRLRGMSDEEIKTELLRDFSLTEEQVDEILATH